MTATRVLIVDDQPIVRAGFAAIVDAEPDLEVCGQAGDGAEALAMAGELEPDVVLMDIRMPGIDGLTATEQITGGVRARSGGPVRVLVLTTFGLDEYVFTALRAGASGFLLKDARPDDVLEAIRRVAAGDSLLDPSVTKSLIDAFVSGVSTPAPGHAAMLDRLTPREGAVLRLVARGLSNAEVGEQLGVGASTVKTHMNAILGKLGLRDRVQATIFAYEAALVRPGLD